MLVVSDATPLHYLVLIGQSRLLPLLFGGVYTAPEVMRELCHENAPAQVRLWASNKPDWLTVQRPLKQDPTLELDPGEAEAICLATELRASIVLLDDRKGARAAVSRGLFVTGTLGVLVLAHDRNLAPLAQSIAALRATNFRATPSILDQLLASRQRP